MRQLDYRAFSDYEKGYSHIQHGMNCEDFAANTFGMSCGETGKPYWIAAACDGHSDKNCFRSETGARFGCESALETLERFFQQYLTQPDEERNILEAHQRYLARLRRSVLCNWHRKVEQDLKEHPLQESELEGLSEKTLSFYRNNKLLENIYGATFLAVGVCEEFFLAMQIGDGIVLAFDEDGICRRPLVPDTKSEMGSPASLCDTDLLSRENAFRCTVEAGMPVAAVVSSDGIEDSLNFVALRERMWEILKGLRQREAPEPSPDELSEQQSEFLKEQVELYTRQGNGAEDDCSLAGFYRLNLSEMPELKLPQEEVQAMQKQLEQELRTMEADYYEREQSMMDTVREYEEKLQKAEGRAKQMKQAVSELKAELEQKQEILQNIRTNSQKKRADFTTRQKLLEKYALHPAPVSLDKPALKVTPPQTATPPVADTSTPLQTTTPPVTDTPPVVDAQPTTQSVEPPVAEVTPPQTDIASTPPRQGEYNPILDYTSTSYVSQVTRSQWLTDVSFAYLQEGLLTPEQYQQIIDKEPELTFAPENRNTPTEAGLPPANRAENYSYAGTPNHADNGPTVKRGSQYRRSLYET